MKTDPFNQSRYWLFVGLLMLLFTVSVFAPSVAAQQPDEQSRLTVVTVALNVRSGPGVTFPAIDFLRQGDQVDILSYDAVNGWWQIQLPNGSSGWVSGGTEYVTTDNTAGISGVAATVANSLSTSETLVFQTAVGGPIYVIDMNGAANSAPRYLTTGIDPVLSPNGQQVAFTRWETSQDGALGSLWVINVDGTGERLIAENILNPRAPTWSPDGEQLIITFLNGGRIKPEAKCGDQPPPRNVSETSTSRSGRKVTYCYTLPADPHWGLRQVNVATGQFEDLPRDTYSDSPAWDPINSWRLVFDGDAGLVNLDLNLGTTWPLTTDINDRSPVFSPDGSKIAVSYWQHDHWEVHVLNADGSGRVRLTETPWPVIAEYDLKGEPVKLWNNAAPTWSPDGTQIAFLTDRSGQWEIWAMNVDGSNQHPLVSGEALTGLGLQYNGVDERVLSWK